MSRTKYPDHKHLCNALIIRDGEVVRDCEAAGIRYCPHCKAWKCQVHAAGNHCNTCGSECVKEVPKETPHE